MDGNRAVRMDDEPLMKALERLEECLRAPLSGRAQDWAERVGWGLAETADLAAQDATSCRAPGTESKPT